jgi:hypothetical protein
MQWLAALLLAFPCGWGLGVTAAYLVAGADFGQLPAFTVPVGILVALVFAVVPVLALERRVQALGVGTVLFVLLAMVTA